MRALLGFSATDDRTRQTGAAIAAEARANGVGMILAPVLDVAREPRWGRIEEDFGEDRYLSTVGVGGSSLAEHGVRATLWELRGDEAHY